MSRRFTIVTVVLSAAVAFLSGLIVAGTFNTAPIVSSAPPSPLRESVRSASLTGPAAAGFADAAERINPAVVNIDSSMMGSGGRDSESYSRRGAGPKDWPPPRDSDAPRQGSGSGFIIDRTGLILTNNHVIDTADRIRVTLADGRVFRAEVVGTDPAIDVALVRIAGGHDLPTAPLGNSDELRVGEWVCAIGNPLGYMHSVTVGVVSFIGRKLFDASLDDYIQTDAFINFGNSGGPLINARGEVIGINAAISSRASNIGFAVPINQAVSVLDQLKTRGRVSRGYMGVLLTDVTPAFQRSLNLSVSRGALVQDVTAGSPADRAGLQPYDVVFEVEGRHIETNAALIRDISARRPGTIARLAVMREARRIDLQVRLAERPQRGDADPAAPAEPRPRLQVPDVTAGVPLGLVVRELERKQMDLPEAVHGVVVSRVYPSGAAFSAAVRRDYVIMEINRQPVRSMEDYQRIVTAAKPGDVLVMYYYDPSSVQRGLVAVTVE
jgi:serine protease Do